MILLNLLGEIFLSKIEEWDDPITRRMKPNDALENKPDQEVQPELLKKIVQTIKKKHQKNKKKRI